MSTKQELLLVPSSEVQHDPAKARLLIVPGYCHYREGAEDYTNPENWFLNKYQRQNPEAELGYILDMIRLSLKELKCDPHLYVAYSGGFTSAEAGEGSSEGGSYMRVAQQMIANPREKLEGVSTDRIILDLSSYNSNHNIWGSLSEYFRRFGVGPADVDFYAYALKVDRLRMVAHALGLSDDRFTCVTVHGPVFTQEDLMRERAIVADMQDDPLLLRPDSNHAQLSQQRNWNNRATFLVPPHIIQEYYAVQDVKERQPSVSLPMPALRPVQVAAD